MLDLMSRRFFSQLSEPTMSWPSLVSGFDVDNLLKIALDCDEIKAKILKEIVGETMFDKLTSTDVSQKMHS